MNGGATLAGQRNRASRCSRVSWNTTSSGCESSSFEMFALRSTHASAQPAHKSSQEGSAQAGGRLHAAIGKADPRPLFIQTLVRIARGHAGKPGNHARKPPHL